MYKVYSDHHDSFLIVETLGEVRELTDATDEQLHRLFRKSFLTINGFPVLNFSPNLHRRPAQIQVNR